jgi:hypothetical protein
MDKDPKKQKKGKSAEPRHFSEKLIGTSKFTMLRPRSSYDWNKDDKMLITNVQTITGFIELRNNINLNDDDYGNVLKEIAYDYYKMNGIYKKKYGENLVCSKDEIHAVLDNLF